MFPKCFKYTYKDNTRLRYAGFVIVDFYKTVMDEASEEIEEIELHYEDLAIQAQIDMIRGK